jgi:hypothetical protein
MNTECLLENYPPPLVCAICGMTEAGYGTPPPRAPAPEGGFTPLPL